MKQSTPTGTLKERNGYLADAVKESIWSLFTREEIFGKQDLDEIIYGLLAKHPVGKIVEEIQGVLEHAKNEILDRYHGCPIPYEASDAIRKINEVMLCLEPLRHIALSLSDLPEPDELPEPERRKYTAA